MHQTSKTVSEQIHLTGQVKHHKSCKFVIRILIIPIDDNQLVVVVLLKQPVPCASYFI